MPGAPDPGDGRSLPLSHITVIDLTRFRSGPTCVRQLADMGARVIQVAPRTIDQAIPVHGCDYQNLHRNKRSITLDLKEPRGVEILKRLVERADVLVENFRPNVKRRLGIDYEALSAVNAGLVYASISGFGEEGPYRDRPGYDQIAQGMGGLMSITGTPGEGPMRVGIPVADLTAGLYLAQGILVALLERERSGRGQWVRTSLLQAMVNMLDFQATRWTMNGEVPPQAGNNHPTVFPTGVFRVKDGLINIAATTQAQWEKLCAVIGAHELAEDGRFLRPKDRSRHRDELTVKLEERLATVEADSVIERLNAAGVPAGPILPIDAVFANEQVRSLPTVATVQHPVLGTIEILGIPVTLSRTPGAVLTAAPEPGVDTDAILEELGYTDAERVALRGACAG